METVPPPVPPIDYALWQSLTINSRFIAKHGASPFFGEAVASHGGLFVRVREAAVDIAAYRWTRIQAVVTTDIFDWAGSRYNISLILQGIDMPVHISCISHQAPTELEIQQYDATYPLAALQLTGVCGELQRTLDTKLLKRVFTADDTKRIIAQNTILGGAGFNLAQVAANAKHKAKTLLAEGGGGAASSSASQEDALVGRFSTMTQPLGDTGGSFDDLAVTGGSAFFGSQGRQATTAMFSPLGMSPGAPGLTPLSPTQIYESPRAAGLESALLRVKSAAECFDSYACLPERTRDMAFAAQLTERNRLHNKRQMIVATANFEAHKPAGRLQEATLLWEVTKEARKKLCDEHDANKDAKDADKKAEDKGDKKKQDPAAVAGPVLSAEDKLLEKCIEARKRRVDVGASQIDDATLEIVRRASQSSSAFDETLVSPPLREAAAAAAAAVPPGSPLGFSMTSVRSFDGPSTLVRVMSAPQGALLMRLASSKRPRDQSTQVSDEHR